MPFFRMIESSCERAAGGRPVIAGGAPEPRPFLTAGDHRSSAAWCWRIKRRDALAGAPSLDPATAGLRLSSPALHAFLARQETLARPSSAGLRACACGPAVVALSTAIRPRWAWS